VSTFEWVAAILIAAIFIQQNRWACAQKKNLEKIARALIDAITEARK
jgi:hypothetical protein